MIFKYFRTVWGKHRGPLSLALTVAAFFVPIAVVPAAHATPAEDEALLGAFDAYRAGDALKFARHAKKLEGHVLSPWVEYWRLSFGLEDATAAELAPYFAQYGKTYPGERLRADWLKVLGKRDDWAEFDREAA